MKEIKTHQDLFNRVIEAEMALIGEFSHDMDAERAELREWAIAYATKHDLNPPEEGLHGNNRNGRRCGLTAAEGADMPKTITKTVYTFAELIAANKEKHVTICDGEIINRQDGRSFRINVTEVTHGA